MSPLQNLDTEKSFLASLLLDPAVIDTSIDHIPSSAATGPLGLFSAHAHNCIWSAMLEMQKDAIILTPQTLVDALARNGTLEAAGGVAYVASLTDVYSPEAAGDLARSLVDYWRRRRLVKLADALKAGVESGSIAGEVDKAEKALCEVMSETLAHEAIDASSFAGVQLEHIEACLAGNVAPGLMTGYASLDRIIQGFRPGQLIILAARPAHGKSALATNIIHDITMRQKLPGIYFSLEMPRAELMDRLLCAEAKVGLSLVRGNCLTTSDVERLRQGRERMRSSKLIIDDMSTLSITSLRAKARRLKTLNPELALIVVDYLQLMAGSGTYRGNKVAEVGEISTSLKRLARELGLPILALAQLNRQAEQDDGDPKLSQLRDSGNLEQDADVVLFIRRKPAPEEERLKGWADEAKVIVAKNRNGMADVNVMMWFFGQYCSFRDVAKKTD